VVRFGSQGCCGHGGAPGVSTGTLGSRSSLLCNPVHRFVVAIGVVLNRSDNQQKADFGSLIVGFSGSWLAGCVFWGWLRAHPVLHLPVEAFALPLALAGFGTRWRLALPFTCRLWWVQPSPI
jgi:hypothetical protein